MKAKKKRLGKLLRHRNWWQTFYAELSLNMHLCGSIDDGYHCELSDADHARIRRQAEDIAMQLANEIYGALRA
jgi:hypothetical protein